LLELDPARADRENRAGRISTPGDRRPWAKDNRCEHFSTHSSAARLAAFALLAKPATRLAANWAQPPGAGARGDDPARALLSKQRCLSSISIRLERGAARKAFRALAARHIGVVEMTLEPEA